MKTESFVASSQLLYTILCDWIFFSCQISTSPTLFLYPFEGVEKMCEN